MAMEEHKDNNFIEENITPLSPNKARRHVNVEKGT